MQVPRSEHGEKRLSKLGRRVNWKGTGFSPETPPQGPSSSSARAKVRPFSFRLTCGWIVEKFDTFAPRVAEIAWATPKAPHRRPPVPWKVGFPQKPGSPALTSLLSGPRHSARAARFAFESSTLSVQAELTRVAHQHLDCRSCVGKGRLQFQAANSSIKSSRVMEVAAAPSPSAASKSARFFSWSPRIFSSTVPWETMR